MTSPAEDSTCSWRPGRRGAPAINWGRADLLSWRPGHLRPRRPRYCSGLPVARYSPDDLAWALGTGFALTAARVEQHTTPDGAVQSFTWVAGTLT